MGGRKHHSSSAAVWRLTKAQHGLITRQQLLALDFTRHAIDHRIETARLHPVHRGVYAVGRPDLTRHGRFMAAVLACGPSAALSHDSAAALWGIRPDRRAAIDVSVASSSPRRRAGVVAHRRPLLGDDEVTLRQGIPVTTPACTLIDLAAGLSPRRLERAIGEADKLDLIDPERLRLALCELPARRGGAALRRILDRRTLVLTDSELERRFVPIARRAALPKPRTRCLVNGFKVDFHWPKLGLVVETDGLRYHRTVQQQARDRLRDQAHTAAGLVCLRFTHDQVVHDPSYVERTLAAVAAGL